jgi:hypothetical protein
MSLNRGLDAARARLLAYMTAAGARATIRRKVIIYGEEGLPLGDSWQTIATDVPVLVETRRSAAGRIDSQTATADDTHHRELTLPHDTDLRAGDRLTVTAPQGTGIDPDQVLTISAVDMHSLAPALAATGTIEENAVEPYPVIIERWDETAGEYVVILRQRAQVVVNRPGSGVAQRGAAGTRVAGTLIFDPAPDVALRPGDSLLGVPWASGATLTQILPVVGSRLEVAFEYTLGGV